MTYDKIRNHPEYTLCMDKIKSYPTGFEFTLRWTQIPAPQRNALRIVMRDAVRQGLVESIESTLSLECIETSETFRKL